MPGTTGRISTLTKAKISALLHRLENPAETIDYAYERQLEDLQTLKGAIAELGNREEAGAVAQNGADRTVGESRSRSSRRAVSGERGAGPGGTERVLDKTETMKARAKAIEQLEAGGAFNELTPLAAPEDDPDAKLEQLQAQSTVDDELAKLKAELQSDDAPQRLGKAPQQPGVPDGRQ